MKNLPLDSWEGYPTREEAFKAVNDAQEFYVNKLIELIDSPVAEISREIFFTSDTGTGKTRMIKMLAQKLPKFFFIVTTLSKAQLDKQTEDSLKDVENIKVFGSSKLKSNTRLTSAALSRMLEDLSEGREVIWVRDEGHLATNCWHRALDKISYRIVNISATNKRSDIRTNFLDTVMLRTPKQEIGTPEDAIKKLMEIKKIHAHVQNYNPCAIFRCTNQQLVPEIVRLCKIYKFNCINKIGDNGDDVSTEELCRDTNPYDVIITYQKFTEGIDIGRAHVVYLQNTPSNIATTIQAIGRCRRNALWNRPIEQVGVDLYDPSNRLLFDSTKICYVYYNKDNTHISVDKDGNPVIPSTSKVSVQELRPEIEVFLKKGKIAVNGLEIAEAGEASGRFKVDIDEKTGFNILKRLTNKYLKLPTYEEETYNSDLEECSISTFCYQDTPSKLLSGKLVPATISYKDWFDSEPKKVNKKIYNSWTGHWTTKKCYLINSLQEKIFVPVSLVENLPFYRYYPYTKIANDRESAIVGMENFIWTRDKITGELFLREETAITQKINSYSKLSIFIENRYKKELADAKPQLFNGKNNFHFTDNRLNSCLGYLVEYYAKYVVYGVNFLKPFTSIAQKELGGKWSNGHTVYACFLKYLSIMKQVYGEKIVKSLIPPKTMRDLIEENAETFIQHVVDLGSRTAAFVQEKLNIANPLSFGDSIHDPNLSTKHLTALCDFINKGTIIDIKVKNAITKNNVLQLLAYHYLSTKRSDLDIHTLIIYDAVSGRSVTINVGREEE